MKRILTILVCALSCLSLIPSCKSTSNDNIINNTANNYIKATPGAASFMATGSSVTVYDSSTFIAITGTTSKGSSLVIDMVNFNNKVGKVGVISVSNPNLTTGAGLIGYVTSGGNPMWALYGYVNITTISSGVVAGTFTATFPDSTKINDGSFYAFW
jgi:hypothetical protein